MAVEVTAHVVLSAAVAATSLKSSYTPARRGRQLASWLLAPLFAAITPVLFGKNGLARKQFQIREPAARPDWLAKAE